MTLASCDSLRCFVFAIVASNSKATVLTLWAFALFNPEASAILEMTRVVSCKHDLDSWWRSNASIPEPDPEINTANRSGFSTVAARIVILSLKHWQRVLPDEVGPCTRNVICHGSRGRYGRAVGVS